MEQRKCEQRQWVRFAWIGEHDGALRVNCTGAANNGLTVDEVNAACNVTIVLSRMVRHGTAGSQRMGQTSVGQ